MPLCRAGVARLVGAVLGVVACAVQAHGQPVRVVDIDYPAQAGIPDSGMSYAERVEMRDPRFGRRPVGNREAYRVESCVAGRGLRVLPQPYQDTRTWQSAADAAHDAVVVGKLPLDGVAQHALVPLAAADQVANWQLDVMNAGELHVCHRYPHLPCSTRTPNALSVVPSSASWIDPTDSRLTT